MFFIHILEVILRKLLCFYFFNTFLSFSQSAFKWPQIAGLGMLSAGFIIIIWHMETETTHAAVTTYERAKKKSVSPFSVIKL